MDALVQKAIRLADALKKPPPPVPWTPDEPWPQPYHRWDPDAEVWLPVPPSPPTGPGADTDTDTDADADADADAITAIALYSWNIDFMLPFAETRMTAALAHLERLAASLPPSTAVVVHLQECTPSDLITISQRPWVRAALLMTDLDSSAWASGLYGTTALVDRRLPVAACFRVHYAASRMQRDALFVDVDLARQRLRLANTHLESLAADPPLRPAQMRLAASYLRGAEGVAGALVAGDFNAIQPFDDALHAANGLRDAFLEPGPRGARDAGFTWGQQALPALRDRFGCSRMDKAFYCGAVRVQSFETFGADVEVDPRCQRQRDALLALGFEKAWVTDHLGIVTTFSLANDTRL
ncbi:uncharacterized protein UV8b_03423 [Ustilaginoidea virens]|uniref:Endonuclease/exonuclease/phosphatase domain-containing protein n=1 Tax=Ustilaginoidea virens TaxID=1159556 RepID=A0A8E5HPN8_USTVR|nr:uncharacterized protein UV8b_03423 [Ustilaginoidea virens]QUC19182.1 hypothetical protein UV8b_03423 [Ustilaginoidea virens]